MVHKTLKTNSRDRRRAQVDDILAHATELALAGGLEGVTIHGLAKAMDYTPGALYRYFPSKAELLAALHLRLVGYLSRRVHAGWAAAEAYSTQQGHSDDTRDTLQSSWR